MEEVEYLEEYEDLILPIMSSNSVAADKSRTNANINGDDEDSSSIDQDIFESLFDDHSDDDMLPPKKVEPKLSQRNVDDRFSLDSLDMLVKDLGEQLSPQSRPLQKSKADMMSGDKSKQSNKLMRKDTTSVQFAANARSNSSLASNVNSSLHKTDGSVPLDKQKSVATVRPTMQQTQVQDKNVSTKAASQNRLNPEMASSSSSSTMSAINTLTGASNASKVVSSASSLPRKQVPNAISTSSGSVNINSKPNVTSSPRKVNRTQATIVKPEKQLSKDPLEDPLSLENLNASDSESDDFGLSDISADTFVSLSDVDEDDRHIIELSNDSSYERGNLEKIRGSTPSPTVSDDFKSDKEESPTKLSNQLVGFESGKPDEDRKEMPSSSLANDNKKIVRDSTASSVLDPAIGTSSEHAKEHLNKPAEKLTAQPDNLLERIDSLLLQTVDKNASLCAAKANGKNVTETAIKSNVTKEKSIPTSLSSTSKAKSNPNPNKDKVASNTAKSAIENKSSNWENKSTEGIQKPKAAKDQEINSDRKSASREGSDVSKEKLKGSASDSKIELDKRKESASIKKSDDAKSSKAIKEKSLPENSSEKKDANLKKSGDSEKAASVETQRKIKADHKSLDSEGKEHRRSEKNFTKTETVKSKSDGQKVVESTKSIDTKQVKDRQEKFENSRHSSDDRKTSSDHYKESDKKRMKDKDAEKYEGKRKYDDRRKEYNKESYKRPEKEREDEKREASKKSYDKDSIKKKDKVNDVDMRDERIKKKHDERRPSDVSKESPKKYVKEKDGKYQDSAKRKTEDYKNVDKARGSEKKRESIKEKETERNDDNTKKKYDDRRSVEYDKGYVKNVNAQERGQRELMSKKQVDERKPVEKKQDSNDSNVKEKDKEVQKKEEKVNKKDDGRIIADNKESEKKNIKEKRCENENSKEHGHQKEIEGKTIKPPEVTKLAGNGKELKKQNDALEKELKKIEKGAVAKEVETPKGDEKGAREKSTETTKKDEKRAEVRESETSKKDEKRAVEKGAELHNKDEKRVVEKETAKSKKEEKVAVEKEAAKPKRDEKVEVGKETEKHKRDNNAAPDKKIEHERIVAEKIEKDIIGKSEKNERVIEKVKQTTEDEKQGEKSADIAKEKCDKSSSANKSAAKLLITAKDEEDKSVTLVSTEGSDESQRTLGINQNEKESSSLKRNGSENARKAEDTKALVTENEKSADESSGNAVEAYETTADIVGTTNNIDKETSSGIVENLENSNGKESTKEIDKKVLEKKLQNSNLEANEIKNKMETIECSVTIEENHKDAVGSKTGTPDLESKDGLTRRTLRKRGNEHSPSNNDRNKKAAKDSITAVDESKQKEQTETVTPTGRKRNRPNISIGPDKEDKESPSNKKQKVDPLKKNTRSMHPDGKEKPIDSSGNENYKEKEAAAAGATTSHSSSKKRNTTESEEPPKKLARTDVKTAIVTSTETNKLKQNICESEELSLTPGKRYRRLKAIDDAFLIHMADKEKSGTSEKSVVNARNTENKQITATRKSLRAKAAEDSQNSATKPNEGNKQSKTQQKPHSERISDATKSGKVLVTGKKQTSSNKPTGSNVMTFTEWLQQKQGEKDESSEVPKRNESRIESNAKRSNNKNDGNTPASSKKNEVRQANQKQIGIVTKTADKTENSSHETKIEESLRAPRESRKKTAANTIVEDFKKPTTPQRSRSALIRATSSTPTPSDGTSSKSQIIGEKTSGREICPEIVNIKADRTGKVFKLRKLRVRINRSVVALYLKKLSETTKQNATTHVKQPVIKSSTTNLVSELNKSATDLKIALTSPASNLEKSTPDLASPAKDSKLNRSREKPTVTITQKRVSLKSNTALSSLSVRPIMSGPANVMTIPPDQRRAPQMTSTGALEELESSAISPSSGETTQSNKDDLSLLTPMKTVSSAQAGNGNRSQPFASTQLQKQSQSMAKEPARQKSNNQEVTHASQNDANVTTTIENCQLPFVGVEPKKELEEEPQTTAPATETSSVNSLASRTLAIAAATNSALNQLPSSDANAFCGLTPTVLDANGTRLYSFLHPAKYNRNHGCVLLDYCCPNLDGPMPAIDPTRIHAQVQAAVRELPAYIVMTTKLITRADLEANKNVIPASIRQKVEKITADANAVNNVSSQAGPISSLTIAGNIASTPLSTLQKNLPSTTTITPKVVPSSATTSSTPLPPLTPFSALTNTQNLTQTPSGPALTEYQRSLLRTHVRQFDARLKKYYYRIAVLTFGERQRVIDGIVNSTAITHKEVESAVRLLDEYFSQINKISTSATSASGVTRQVVASNAAQKTGTINTQTQQKASGYQLTSTTFTMNKSTMSTRSSAMSASSVRAKNTSLPNVALMNTSCTNLKTVSQDSPRIFYTKTPLQTSTPIATTSATGTGAGISSTPVTLRSTPRMGRNVAIRQLTPSSTSTSSTTKEMNKCLPALTRNPHLSTPTTSSDGHSINTVTTRSSVTVTTETKRLTRKTAAAAAQKVIVITQNDSRNTLDECILPDDHGKPEIKREKDDEDFIGGG